MERATATAFGAPWADPFRTAGGLRARASAAGVILTPADRVDVVDLAAAVVGAHVWSLVTGLDNLGQAYRCPTAERAAAARILARAAGQLPPAPELEVVVTRWVGRRLPTRPPAHLKVQEAAQVLTWLPEVGDEPTCSRVLTTAADDLLEAGTDAMAALGALLLAEAELASAAQA
jgi:hypothetical protein